MSRGPDARPRFLSLFSGCGGLDLGFLQAGFDCAAAIDHNRLALATHARNIPGATILADLSVPVPLDVGPIDALVAGPPCQGFSTLGKCRAADPRNALLQVPAQVAAILQPRFVVIENVAGAQAPVHSLQIESTRATLIAAGYKVQVVLLDMTQFGLPQRRRRIVLLGWRGASEFTVRLEATAPRTLMAVVGGSESAANHAPVSPRPGSRAAAIASAIGIGQKLCNVRVTETAVRTWEIPNVFGPTSQQERAVLESLVRLRRRNRTRDHGDADPVVARRLTASLGHPTHSILRSLLAKGYVRRIGTAYDLTHTFNGKFRRPRPDGLAPAVDTRFGDFHYVLHPVEDRAFSVREAARIQGFPDGFVFEGSRRDQHRLVANAVPPPAAAALASAIAARLQDN